MGPMALPAARLSVAGSGPLREELEQLAATLGVADRVRFTGRLDRDQMAALYREADLSLNPSHVDNMPNSVLESLASGVPVVSTDVGGVPFIVEHGRTALLVPANDAQAMGAAALQLLTDPACAAGLRSAGLQAVQRCRDDELMAGLHGRSGGRVDSLGPICRAIGVPVR